MKDLSSLARNGILRAAINTGNTALVQVGDNTLSGVSPALAQRLATEIGATLEPVIYPGAGKVFADCDADAWDVAFLAIDTARAKKISFTRPYHTIEAAYATRVSTGITRPRDADVVGRVILTSSGSAYEWYLKRNLQNATLEHTGSPHQSFDEFRAGRGDFVAGVRVSLEEHFRDDNDIVVLAEPLTTVDQALALPGPANPLIPALDDFVRCAIEDSFVADHF